MRPEVTFRSLTYHHNAKIPTCKRVSLLFCAHVTYEDLCLRIEPARLESHPTHANIPFIPPQLVLKNPMPFVHAFKERALPSSVSGHQIKPKCLFQLNVLSVQLIKSDERAQFTTDTYR